jgi:cytochrome P450
LLSRVAAEDLTLGGQRIQNGSRVLLALGAAQRDPEAYADPDRLDITRGAKPLAFGRGIHFCIGAALGRLEATIALEEILTRFEVSLLREPSYKPTLALRGPLALDLRVSARTR